MVTQNLPGHHLDWPSRRPAVVSWFRRLDPDVVSLQEAVVTHDHDQVTEVVDDGYHVTHHPLLTASFVEEIVARTGQHVVVAGDLDAMPEAAGLRFWRGVQALDGTSAAYPDVWELTHRDDPGYTFAPSAAPLVTES